MRITGGCFKAVYTTKFNLCTLHSAHQNVSRPVFGDLIGLFYIKKMVKVAEVTETKAFMRGVEALCARDDRC